MANTKLINFDQLQSSMTKIKSELDKKASNNHGTHVEYYDENPKVAGTTTAGSSSKLSRGDHVHPAQTTITGNAGTATKLQTARTLTIGNTGKTFDGSTNVSWDLNEIGAIPLTGSAAISGNLEFAQSNTTIRGIIGSVGDNDYWRIVGGATASNAGYLEIATANDATEPIYVRQYGNGKFETLTRTATLLDDSGNTSFPGTVSATGGFNGNASSATKLNTIRSINGTNFDGTANITTANWGTARILTIGNSGKSVNGSGNVSWSLSEIGAASSGHTHNNIVSRGNVTAESGTTRPTVDGLSMTQAYNNGYPSNYGNVLSMRGQGDGELFIGWSGTSGGQAPVYVRSKRDTGDANWSEWAQIYTSSLTTKTVSSGSLTLGTELYQYAAITSNTTIKLPSVSAFTEIHLFFNWPANVSVTMPSGVKWQQGVMYGPGHVHEFMFTYVNNIGWLGGCVVYG